MYEPSRWMPDRREWHFRIAFVVCSVTFMVGVFLLVGVRVGGLSAVFYAVGGCGVCFTSAVGLHLWWRWGRLAPRMNR